MKIFNFNKDFNLDMVLNNLDILLDIYIRDNYRTCEKCGCLISKNNLKTVEETFHGKNNSTGIIGYTLDHIAHYYCLVHKPPYSKIKQYPQLDKKTEYFADDVQVDESGKLIIN